MKSIVQVKFYQFCFSSKLIWLYLGVPISRNIPSQKRWNLGTCIQTYFFLYLSTTAKTFLILFDSKLIFLNDIINEIRKIMYWYKYVRILEPFGALFYWQRQAIGQTKKNMWLEMFNRTERRAETWELHPRFLNKKPLIDHKLFNNGRKPVRGAILLQLTQTLDWKTSWRIGDRKR